ncbi:MAG: ABC transporter permease subunit [Leptolyngbyaceae cyanobacterium SM1_1_3]|nr:ABC transporter permease subunit [Leptolyngbyaceae cyanobacterium SM1_1_3]
MRFLGQSATAKDISPRSPRSIFSTERLIWLLLTTAAIAGSLFLAGYGQRSLINWGGWPQFWQFVQASLHPELDPVFLRLMGKATLITLAYAVCGTGLSLSLGLLAGILASAVWWRTLWPRWANLAQPAWLTVRAALSIPRAIHELIWGLFFLSILGLDPLVAVLAIAVPFSAIVAKVFSEILDETPSEPLQALVNTGTPPLSAFLYGLLPQALPNLLSYSFYRFECSLRSAAVLGVIGAGGLGYQILLSLQSLRYEELWTGFYALILLNGAVDTWSGLLRRKMGFTSRLDLSTGQPRNPAAQAIARDSASSRVEHPSTAYWVRFSLAGIACAIPLCFWSLQLDWTHLWSDRTGMLLRDILTQAQPGIVTIEQVRSLADLTAQTLAMSVLAMVMAGLGGVVFSFLAAQTFWLPGGILYPIGQHQRGSVGAWSLLGTSRLVLLVSRAVPTPIWALVFLYILFPGILPGAIALGLHNLGILGRLMAEVNENLEDEPVRSLRSLGASGLQTILYGFLPQNLPRFTAYSLYRWEVCLRETVIVGLVGAGGLGRLIAEQLSSFDYGGLVVTLSVFIGLTFVADLISAAMRRAVR